MLLARLAFGERCLELLTRVRGAVERIAAPLLAAGAGVAGVVLVARGAGGMLA